MQRLAGLNTTSSSMQQVTGHVVGKTSTVKALPSASFLKRTRTAHPTEAVLTSGPVGVRLPARRPCRALLLSCSSKQQIVCGAGVSYPGEVSAEAVFLPEIRLRVAGEPDAGLQLTLKCGCAGA